MTPLKKRNLVHGLLEGSAGRLPDKHALVHGNVRATFGELNRDANRVARSLIKRGIAPGDRVLLLLENCLEYVIAYYGCLKAGGVAVPLSPDLPAESLAAILEATGARVIVSSWRGERTLQSLDMRSRSTTDVLIANPKMHLGFADDFTTVTRDGDATDPGVALDERDLASIIFTSGSTGTPKGVMLTHRNIVANTGSIVSYLELTSADIQMVVLPFFYVMGKSLLNTHMAVGGTVVINNTFAYPATVVQQMIDEQVTGFSGVPSTFAYLLHRSPLKEVRERLTSLRYCSQAGGHMARHTKEELLKVLPAHTQLYVMYGATEAAARLTYVEPDRLADKIDSIGIPIPGVTMTVVGEQGEALPQGETGELVASGANIMPGYWKDPAATARALGRHGFHTGDMGYKDSEGYFYVVGRRDNQLKVGGHRINPQEIEDALMATDRVFECAILGVPDPIAGLKLVALAVPIDQQTTEREILSLCAHALPRHKRPTEIRFSKSLPKNSSGKIDRRACMSLL